MSTITGASGKPNIKGGKGYKKAKTGRVRAAKHDISLDVEGGEGYYGTVTKLLGEKRIEVKLHDGNIKQATIPGRMYKKQWIKPGFTVLINNDYEIMKIVREHDKDAKEANELLQKSSGTDNIFRQIIEEDSGDDEVADTLGMAVVSEIRNPNMKQVLERKAINKERDITRRAGKQFTDFEALNAQVTSTSPVNIDDI